MCILCIQEKVHLFKRFYDRLAVVVNTVYASGSRTSIKTFIKTFSIDKGESISIPRENLIDNLIGGSYALLPVTARQLDILQVDAAETRRAKQVLAQRKRNRFLGLFT